MLPFQVGAIDGSRQGDTLSKLSRRAVPVNRVYRRGLLLVCTVSFMLCWMLAASDALAQSKSAKKKGRPNASPAEQGLTNIPLPIGHEAKGLVLPDFDPEGHLRGRFEAGTAHRIDQEHIGFKQLKITTYTPENQPDLTIDLSEAILNLKTRILSSKERTTIKSADFNIAGDSVEFDTNTRAGKLFGNVKMVITSQSKLLNTQNQSE